MTDRAPILDQLDGQWQQIAAVLVWKLIAGYRSQIPAKAITITVKDFEEFEAYMNEKDRKFLTWGHFDSIKLLLIPSADAERLAQHLEQQGGRADRTPS